MGVLREQRLVGVDYLEAVTVLLQRTRGAHPTAGLYEAADLQWWWRTPRPTDDLPQLFWFDDLGRPAAAAITTDWGDRSALDPIVLPDATVDWLAHVIGRGLVHAGAAGIEAVEIEADRDADDVCELLAGLGFKAGGDGVVEAWLAADARSEVSPLHEDYRASSRLETGSRPHPMIGRNGPDVEARLRQTSLYRPELDLVVLDRYDRVAAYGLFWYDPVTATGLVEPMRTEDQHQRRGLARHVLTAGIDRLAAAGAERIKICYEPDNPAAGELYLGVGFQPVRRTVAFYRPGAAPASSVSN